MDLGAIEEALVEETFAARTEQDFEVIDRRLQMFSNIWKHFHAPGFTRDAEAGQAIGGLTSSDNRMPF